MSKITPKEKAKELINRYLKILAGGFYDVREEAKQCALICVDEILSGSRLFYIEDYDYWREVKKEIELLK